MSTDQPSPPPDIQPSPLPNIQPSTSTVTEEKEHWRVRLQRLSLGQNPPEDVNIPAPSTIQESQPTEHWSVRLKRLPLPCGRTYEDLANRWKPWHETPNPNPAPELLRRSPRLYQQRFEESRKPENCVFFPGQNPPEVYKRTQKRRRIRRNMSPRPPELDLFTEEEREEMFLDIVNNPGPMPPKYEEYAYDDDFVSTYPIITVINEATIAYAARKQAELNKDVENT